MGSSVFQAVYTSVQDWYGRCFYGYGQWVAKYPIPFIVVPILVFGLLGLGMLRMKFETDIEYLYTPINSQAVQDREKVKALFPDMTGTNYNTYSLNTEDRYGEVLVITDGNVFANDSITEIRDLVERIQQFQAEDDDIFGYDDVCARNLNSCVISGAFALSNPFLFDLEQENVTYPVWSGLDLTFSLAGVNSSGNVVHSASVLKLTFHLRQDTVSSRARALVWEDDFIQNMKKQRFRTIRVYFAASQSLGKELNENTGGDFFSFSLSFTLLTTYASFMAGGDCVGSTEHLTRAGVLAAVLGVLGAFGFISLCGLKFVNIVGIMPFLVLAIGVDDMFLMLSAWKETNKHGDDWGVTKRVGHTFRLAGVGITITSLTDLLAFIIGYTSVFNSIKHFCIYTGTAIIFCYLAHVTFFTGCLAIHGRRVEASRHCCTCMKIPPRDEDGQQSCLEQFCCTGQPPRERGDNVLIKILQTVIIKHVLTKPGKIVTLFGFTVYLGVSIWGTTRLQQGLFLKNLVPPSSYYHNYSNANYHHFDVRIPVSYVMEEQTDYLNGRNLKEFSTFLNDVANNDVISRGRTICWLTEYMNSFQYDNSSLDTFVIGLREFLTFRRDLANDVVFDETGPKIKGSRCYIISRNVPESTDQANLMLTARDLAERSLLPVFAYHPVFVYFEQFVSILPTLLRTLGIAVVTMVITTVIFLPHPVIALLVLFNIVLILVGVFGFMAFWDLSISSVTMIHLIICVGFAVDFTVHVCTAFMVAEGETRNMRAKNAVIHAVGPIFNGGMSTLVGVITLVASQSYVFQSFFRIIFLVVVFGIATAVFLMPVVLSLIGPVVKRNVKENLHQLNEM